LKPRKQAHSPLFADKMDCGWIFELVLPYIAEWDKSVACYPNIKPGEEVRRIHRRR
jgi:hypothetical protein